MKKIPVSNQISPFEMTLLFILRIGSRLESLAVEKNARGVF
jgi:hypothetical protein